MPLAKHNSIMSEATGLISKLFNVALSRDVFFFGSSNACIMVLLKLALVLLYVHSFLHYHIGNDLLYGFSATLGKCSANRGASYTIICSECYQVCLCIAG